MVILIRWVSVVEFHDPTLIIGKVFGQESTVVKWNYQILGLHPVAVRQKLGVILVIKWFKNWSKEKMLFTKKVRLNWYSSMKIFLVKIQMIFDIENSLWKSKIGTFWRTVTRCGDSKSGNFVWLQMILGQKPCFLGLIQLVRQKVNIHHYIHIIYNCWKTLTQSIRVSWRANRLSGISVKSENWLLLAAPPPPLPTASEAGEAWGWFR